MIRWEEVRRPNQAPFRRARVIDGWVVVSGYSDKDPGQMTFVRDEELERERS